MVKERISRSLLRRSVFTGKIKAPRRKGPGVKTTVVTVSGAVFVAIILLILMNYMGFIVFVNMPPSLGRFLISVYQWLGPALYIFLVIVVLYYVKMLEMYRAVRRNEYEIDVIMHLDAKTDLLISAFINTGVIFTALGMVLALNSAVGGLTAEAAKELGAWGILKSLMDKGLTMALGTTVVGGAGGLAMKLVKHYTVGRRLSEIEVREREMELAEEKEAQKKLIAVLEDLKAAVESTGSGSK